MGFQYMVTILGISDIVQGTARLSRPKRVAHHRLCCSLSVMTNSLMERCMNICTLEGCNHKAVRDLTTDKPICEMHYCRRRRNGNYDLIGYQIELIGSHGYVSVRDYAHPLSDSQGRVYKHRQVLYNSDPDMHCFNCGALRTWSDCHVDHIDEDKQNNLLSNLRIACPACNQARGRGKQKQTMRDIAPQITFNGKSRCISEWAEIMGFEPASLQWRLKHWSLHDAMTRPLRVNCRRK